MALFLCPRAEAEKYRAGAEAFIDRLFFQEEIEECLAYLREVTAATSAELSKPSANAEESDDVESQIRNRKIGTGRRSQGTRDGVQGMAAGDRSAGAPASSRRAGRGYGQAPSAATQAVNAATSLSCGSGGGWRLPPGFQPQRTSGSWET